MSEPGELHEAISERIAGRFGLQVRESNPLVSLTGVPVGEWNTLIGPELDKAVTCEISFDDAAQPSKLYGLYVFARPSALVPHLLIEWSEYNESDGEDAKFGLLADLAPRVDLGVNSQYVDEVYTPLTTHLNNALTIKGVAANRVSPLRAIALSPWTLSVTTEPSSLDELAAVVDHYLDHWIATVSGGVGSSVDPLAADPAKLVQHDRYHREALFAENSSELWPRIYQLVGPNQAAELRMALRSQEAR